MKDCKLQPQHCMTSAFLDFCSVEPCSAEHKKEYSAKEQLRQHLEITEAIANRDNSLHAHGKPWGDESCGGRRVPRSATALKEAERPEVIRNR